MFKPGDKVKCIMKDSWYKTGGSVTVGEIYTVETHQRGDNYSRTIRVKEADGIFWADCFELVAPEPLFKKVEGYSFDGRIFHTKEAAAMNYAYEKMLAMFKYMQIGEITRKLVDDSSFREELINVLNVFKEAVK